jgi:galactokinase
VQAEKVDDFIKKLKEEYFRTMQRKTEAYLCQASSGAYTENIQV